MQLFGKKEEYEDPEEFIDTGPARRKFRDLNPQNRRRRREPIKPWTKKDRIIVLVVLLLTVIIAGVLDLTSKDWKLPNLPKLGDLNPFKEETVTLGNDTQNQAKAGKITAQFTAMTSSLNGIYAFTVVDLDNGFTYGVNQNEVINAASLIKLHRLGLWYQLMEQGKISFGSTYYLKDADRQDGNGSLGGEPTGFAVTYGELADYMAKDSDNTASYITREILGDEVIKQSLADTGMTHTSLDDGTSTAADMGLFLQKLWNGQIVSTKSRDEILNLLTDTEFENWLVKGIPTGVRVAHKYGREVGVVNDAGIVYAARPFAVVIMSQGIIEQEADDIFPQLAQMIYSGETQ